MSYGNLPEDSNPFLTQVGGADEVPSLFDGPPPQADPMAGRDPTLDAIMADLPEDRDVTAMSSDQLQFQDFKPTATPAQGTMHAESPMPSSSQLSGQSPSDTDSLMMAHQAEEGEDSPPIYSIAYYQKFFDVDTSDVASRIMKGMMPFNTKFIEEVAPNPDLYGPFWVSTTLIFAMAAAGNFANYLGSQSNAVWTYDFNKVTFAACVVYGYSIFLPMAINFTAMYFTEAVGFIQLVSVYGYSLSVFVIASILCIVPSELLRWVFVTAAFVVSGGVIWGNIGGRLENLIPGKGQAVTIALVLIHAALALVFKLYFFEYQSDY